MKLRLPDKLFGRIFRAPALPQHARMKAMWGKNLPDPPASYSVDANLRVACPPRLWLNGTEGDCVIAARANQQTRFVAGDKGLLINIADAEVQAEYMGETGGQDTGLVPEDSLSLWQVRGWTCAGVNRKIRAWGRIDATDQLDVKRAISLLQGCQFSFALPAAWNDALNAGEVWDAPPPGHENDPQWQPGSWGGHQMYVHAYSPDGATVLTWGKDQTITWAGVAHYGSLANQGEAQAIVRTDSTCRPVDGLDVDKLLAELRQIQAA